MSLLVKFNLILLLVFAAALAPAAWVTNRFLQEGAKTQVIQNARIMMDGALATRAYTSDQIVGLLERRVQEEFIPQTVPSYAATEIFSTIRKHNPEYSYKEATLNPTNPRDRTTDWEADVVRAFQNDPKLTEVVGERDGGRGRSLHLARPIRIVDAKCLACHDTADRAPAPLIKTYGPDNGFGWKLDEVVGAQIVSVPMRVPFKMADSAFKAVLGTVAAVFACLFVILDLLLWLAVVRPIGRLSALADRVADGDLDGAEFPARGKDEVAKLAGSFNRMRISLAKAMRLLEDP